MKDRNQEALVLLLGGILLAVLAIGQEKRQEWKLKPSGDAGKYHFTVEISKPHHRSSHGTDVPVERFQGLAPDPFSRGGSAKFDYVHDAGRFLCQGRFSWSRGSGTFTFAPNPQFPAELVKLGYDEPDSDQVFEMMLIGMGLDFARSVKDAGVRASTRKLLDLRHHGVTLEYIQGMRQAGYENLTADNYIELRDHGVKLEFAASLREAGYDLSAGRLVELRDHGVNSEYMLALKNYGLRPQASDIVRLRDHGVNPEFLKGLRDAGYDNLSASQITDLRNHGVSVDFIQEAKDLGYDFKTQEMIELRNQGVNGSYLRRIRDSGMKNLTASQIAKLKMHGVD